MDNEGLATRFKLVYIGDWADSGVLGARSFGLSLVGVNDLISGLAEVFDVPEPIVRIEGEVQKGSFVTTLSAVVPHIVEFATQNETVLDAVAAIFAAATAVGGFFARVPIWLIHLRKAYAEMKTAEAQQRAAENANDSLDQKISYVELQRLKSDAIAYLNGERDSELMVIVAFLMSERGQVALQRMAAPLISNEASAMRYDYEMVTATLSGGRNGERLIGAIHAIDERVAAAALPAPETLGKELDVIETEISVLSAQFDGRRSGWRFVMDGKAISATVYDEDFLNAVRTNTVELHFGRLLRVLIRKRTDSPRSSTYDVTKVFL